MTRAAPPSKRILLFGATGTAGRGALAGLLEQGHEVTCFVRQAADLPTAVTQIIGDVQMAADVQAAFKSARIDAVMSCLASRTGLPAEAWAIDCEAHRGILRAAQHEGVPQFVLLSAICVQRPKLAFQHAKLAFEADLQASGLTYSIVRPTAFFKSLSGQMERVRQGKPFLVFGDGALTACKPISDRDLGRYLALCLTDEGLQNRVLPIGGPGPAITPLTQAQMLGDALGLTPKVRHVPVAMMSVIIGILSSLGLVHRRSAERAEFAKIGKYYGTESMLHWDAAREAYDADGTPEFGTDTLQDHYRALATGEMRADLGAHAAF